MSEEAAKTTSTASNKPDPEKFIEFINRIENEKKFPRNMGEFAKKKTKYK